VSIVRTDTIGIVEYGDECHRIDMSIF
jgi:hypothetical protein